MSHTRRRARELQQRHHERRTWEQQFQATLDACPDEQERWRVLARAQLDMYGYVSVQEPYYLFMLGLHREPFDSRHPRGELPPVIRRERG